jgi:hypothetical protein
MVTLRSLFGRGLGDRRARERLDAVTEPFRTGRNNEGRKHRPDNPRSFSAEKAGGSARGPARQPPGRPAGRSRVGRWSPRDTVENSNAMTPRALKGYMRDRGFELPVSRNRAVVVMDGQRWEIRLAWRPRLLRNRPYWRAYFVCPGCGHRRNALFPSEHGPRCRVCLDLTYQCRTMSARRRHLRRVQKIRHRMDCPCTTDELLRRAADGKRPEKPPRMWRSKFARLEHQRWRATAKVKGHQLGLKRNGNKHPAWRW